MPEKKYKVQDVFGISRDIPLNYQTRETADDILVDSLTRQGRRIKTWTQGLMRV